jgi:hypothetical protein
MQFHKPAATAISAMRGKPSMRHAGVVGTSVVMVVSLTERMSASAPHGMNFAKELISSE